MSWFKIKLAYFIKNRYIRGLCHKKHYLKNKQFGIYCKFPLNGKCSWYISVKSLTYRDVASIPALRMYR